MVSESRWLIIDGWLEADWPHKTVDTYLSSVLAFSVQNGERRCVVFVSSAIIVVFFLCHWGHRRLLSPLRCKTCHHLDWCGTDLIFVLPTMNCITASKSPQSALFTYLIHRIIQRDKLASPTERGVNYRVWTTALISPEDSLMQFILWDATCNLLEGISLSEPEIRYKLFHNWYTNCW